MIRQIKIGGAVTGGALMALFGASGAFAADNVSGDVGITYNSHFVSFGADVWGAGDDFYGDRSTTSIYGDLAIKVTDDFTISLNGWSDINDNVPSGIGGHLQEVDFNVGGAYTVGKFTISETYGAWSYGGDVEQVLDTAVGFDDTGVFIPDFAFNPKVLWHYRVSGNGAQQIGSAIVLSIGPSFPLGGSFSLAIPAGVAFFTTDDFQGGTKSGYGYSYLGGSLSTPLTFIPAAYGAWTVNFDLIAYFTEHDAIPGNPQESFLTGSLGLKVAY
jgi:hypothetical protein